MANNAEIGRLGESIFETLCIRAGLVCNKSNPDLTGWDFIVEFPFAPGEKMHHALDARRPPLSCRIQVKTILGSKSRFSMRLSSAELLAKAGGPTFVYVLNLNERKEQSGAYLIHFMDAPLAKILKRLRLERAAGNVAINNKTILMSGDKDGVSVEPDDAAFREAILAACGADPHDYAERKNQQLEKLGFPDRPIEMSATLGPLTGSEFVDFLLGIKKDVPSKGLRGLENRFGIKLPLIDHSNVPGIMTVTPSRFDTCRVAFRDNSAAPPTILEGEIFLPAIPGLPLALRKYKVDTGLLCLIVGQEEISIEIAELKSGCSPEKWLAYWRVNQFLASGHTEIEISADSFPTVEMYVIDQKLEVYTVDQCKYYFEMTSDLISVLDFAGVQGDVLLEFGDIFEARSAIRLIKRLINPDETAASYSGTTPFVNGFVDGFQCDMLVVDYLGIGGTTLAWSAVARMIGTRRDDKIDWKSEAMSLKRLSHLRFPATQYESFIEAAKRETGCTSSSIRSFRDGSVGLI
jgi:hypothetical protein